MNQPASAVPHNAPDEQHQKDMLAMLFPPGFPSDHSQQSPHQPSSQSAQDHNSNFPFNSSSNLDMLSNIVPDQTQSQYNPSTLLEQQIRLSQIQQLQQLQNQIFQQQIALISGQTPAQTLNEQTRENAAPSSFNGLPTPGPSTELRAQSNNMDFVSPMMLDYLDPSGRPAQHGIHDLMHPPAGGMLPPSNRYNVPPRGSTSAPADIAFGSHPSDMDFDVSPLTSPWLGPNHNGAGSPLERLHNRATASNQSASTSANNKRAASSSSDESMPARKKASPAIRPSFRRGGSKSTHSTPLMGTPTVHPGGVARQPADTPSPVDLSVLPPPPPPGQVETANSESQDHIQRQHNMLPVTPASIMNMSRVMSTTAAGSSVPSQDEAFASKGRGPPKGSTTPKTSTRTSSRKNSTSSVPGLKNILPAATTSTSKQSITNGGGPPKKTSHKAAEQKRRDSMKMTYDELRSLLPPIPLANSPSSPSVEPLLPGALPPRGPPKSGGDGPNKGISKLQLLICANGYIKKLKARVERRDQEVDLLRHEIRRLQALNLSLTGDSDGGGDGDGDGFKVDGIDLEKDLDEVEKYEKEGISASFRMFAVGIGAEGGEGDDEDD